MCDPTMMLLSATALQTVGSAQQLEDQSVIDNENAEIAEQSARVNAALRRKQAAKLSAQQRVAFLNSGVTLEGTPEDVLTETSKDEELDALAILHSGQLNANAHRQSARAKLDQRSGVIFGGIAKGASFLI